MLMCEGQEAIVFPLSKVKDLLGSAKRSQVNTYTCLSTTSSSVHPDRLWGLFLSTEQVNELFNAEHEPLHIFSIPSGVHHPHEVLGAGPLLQDHLPTPTSNTGTGSVPMEIDEDEGLSLAQQRS